MTAIYDPKIRSRTLRRKVLDTCSAYVRIDLVEERMFPLTTVLRFAGLIFPVMLYYFQNAFLHLSPENYSFMLIGTAVTTGLADALAGLTARLQFAQERGTLESYLVEPAPWALIPVAMNIWRSFTGTMLACSIVALGWCLGAPIDPRGIPLGLVVLVLGVVACNAVGALAASFLILFKRGDPVIMFYGLAASVLGGTLFAPSVLPAWIRWASYLVPHSYVIGAERNLLMTNAPSTGMTAGPAVIALILFCALGLTVSLYLFNRALVLARRLGVLAV